MKTSRFDMAQGCRDALRMFAELEQSQSKSVDQLSVIERIATSAMEACDRTSEEGRADHGALLLFLCGIDDLKKHERATTADERGRLFRHATQKLRSAQLQYERA